MYSREYGSMIYGLGLRVGLCRDHCRRVYLGVVSGNRGLYHIAWII